ncbi:fatty acyl-AMP ligase [Streptomyces sp. MP131-18]|uniref:fatty acyl-AMP ligase n=1 Tax=Streptomyces sp. MP131-18 TaxID=1857892 RepID=UPI00097C5A47|nr:fatty acyl-AMP ligase [Streptomyces sp. MP131-18]ONK11258.1 putative fatty-acid--CoA ligase fadD21 [Streptomyces sp. MP131-18]
MTGSRSFTEHVRKRVAEAPGRDAVLLLGDDAGPAAPHVLDYAGLDALAQRLAAWLRDRGAAGERVLVLCSSPGPFVAGVLACLYAGAIAVPAPWPGDRRAHARRAAAIARDAAVGVALTSRADAAVVSQLLAEVGRGHVPCLPVDAVPDAGDWRMPDLRPDSVALLQYTSGSTREPRGVMVTHGNLLANQRAIARTLGTAPGTRLGGWLPLYHDLGLIGQFLHPLWLGATAVLMPPAAFLRSPAAWLRAIGDHGIAVSGAPDFAYEQCARRVTDAELSQLDLSGWEIAVSGGEPVRERTLRAFAERFAPAGFRAAALTPCYGLAEATLLVTGAARGARRTRRADPAALAGGELRAPEPGAPARTLVGCGPADAADGELLVVEPETGRVLPEGRVGEVWVRGEGVAAGYWNRSGAAAAPFHGSAEGAGAGWLRTGDLGVAADGELFVTGRLKELIAVAGRHLYPQDVEDAVREVSDAFGACVAFGVHDEPERLVVVQEVRAGNRYRLDLAGLAAAVRDRVAHEFGVVPAALLLVRTGTVRRTTSGKQRRGTMRRLFLAGELRPLHQEVLPGVPEAAGPQERTLR